MVSWLKAKEAKRKRQRWGKNPQRPAYPSGTHNADKGMFSGTVLVRDHVKSMGEVISSADDEGGVFHNAHQEVKMRTDQVHKSSERMEIALKAFQSSRRQGFEKWLSISVFRTSQDFLRFFFHGTQAYYMYSNNVTGTVQTSGVMTVTRARYYMTKGLGAHKLIAWVESRSLTEQDKW